MKVLVLARKEKDKDYLMRLLKEGKGITFAAPLEPMDAAVIDADLLTPAEREILQAIVQNGSIAQVAVKTCRTPETVKKHLRSIRRKLGVKTTLQAVALAFRLRLIDKLSR